MILLAALAGATFALGLLMLFSPVPVRRRPRPRRRRLPADALVGAAAGALLLVVLRWPVAAVAGGLLAAQAAAGLREARAERKALERREALAEAAARWRDASNAGLGLLEAIELAADTASEALRAELETLRRTARTRGPGLALQAWAASTNDPLVRVFAHTVDEARRQGSEEEGLLEAFAQATAKEARTARETAARAGLHRMSATLIAGLGVAFLLYLRLTTTSYARAYDDFAGQAAMAVGFAPIALGYFALLRAGRIRPGLAWGGDAAPAQPAEARP